MLNLPQSQPTLKLVYVPRACVIEIPPGVHYNVNLREWHDRLYGPPHPNDAVHFTIAPGAVILSRSPDLPALRTGEWPW